MVKENLFSFLDEIPSLIEAIKNEDTRKAEKVLKINRLETCLVEFIHNFLIQVFNKGYKIQVDGVNPIAFDKIQRELGSKSRDNPMVSIFEKTMYLTDNMERAVYSSPPREDVLENVYLNFVPEMFRSFTIIGKEMTGYAQIVKRIEIVLETIEKLKGPSSCE